jgi:hypothetical protein
MKFSTIVIAVGLLAVGCRRPAERDADQGVGMNAPSIASQVAAVKAGEATRVVAEHPLSDAEWNSLRRLAGLRELILGGGVAVDARADLLAGLPDIERLVLRESPLSDAGFEVLGRCTTLRDLNVPQAACTPAGIRALRHLPHLRSLRLGGVELAGVGAEVGDAVADLAHLRSLHLIDVPIGDRGLAAISHMSSLWNLYLDGAGVSDEAWGRYFEAHPRVHVHVEHGHHDRDPRRRHD